MTRRACTRIPQTFHRVWLDEPVPDEYEHYWKAFQEMHPDYEFVTWSAAADLDWMENWELFQAFPAGRQQTLAFRADVARYEILLRYGGIYVDTDVEPLRPFDELTEDPRMFIAWCSDKELDPAVMGAPAGHGALRALVSNLAGIDPHSDSPPGTTGPTYATSALRGRADVRRLPPVAFFPYHWRDMTDRERMDGFWPERSYAVHHWAAGWKP